MAEQQQQRESDHPPGTGPSFVYGEMGNPSKKELYHLIFEKVLTRKALEGMDEFDSRKVRLDGGGSEGSFCVTPHDEGADGVSVEWP